MCKEFFITSVVIDGNNVNLNTSPAITTCCEIEHFKLRFATCVEVPEGIEALEVQVSVNGDLQSVLNKTGLAMVGADLVRTFNGKIDRRFVYKATWNGEDVLISNAPQNCKC